MKKVLIITYYWPPSAGGGVQRWLKFAKYLPANGWEPVVFTPENPAFDQIDESLLKDVSDDLEVIHFPIWEPLQVFKKVSGKKTRKQGIVSDRKKTTWIEKLIIWIRGNIFIPDPRKYWTKPSSIFLRPFIEERNIDLVITTGPPHSMHLIGKRLKSMTGVKWIADFRDPWSEWDILDDLKTSTLAKKMHRRLERSVLREASCVLTVSHKLKDRLEILGGNHNVEVITNGMEKEDLDTGDQSSASKFRVTHLGLINHMRNPENLWKQLELKCKKDQGFSDNLEIYMAGTVDQRILDFLQSSELLREKLVYTSYVPHDEISKVYQESTVLLLLMNRSKNADWLIPGKLFEYMATNRAILACGSLESEVNDMLLEQGVPGVVAYDDDFMLMKRLDEQYESYIKGDVHVKYRNIDQYERKNLTEKLVNIFNQTVEGA